MRLNFSYKLFLLPLFFMICGGSLSAQEKMIFGKILNEADAEGIHVINTSSKINTITNENGEFYIRASLNDTLLISSISYIPKQVEVGFEIFSQSYLEVILEELVTQLDEVFLRPALTGDLERDIKNIAVEDALNFDDVGIPGFKGKPAERIPPLLGGVITPLSVDLEGLYKHLSGYYKKLKLKRAWDRQNNTAVYLMNQYTLHFFEEAYKIPSERVYEFLLFCIETTELQSVFRSQNHALVLDIFEKQSIQYISRISEKRE